MSIVLSDGNTAEPEQLIRQWCGRIRAWWRRRRERRRDLFGETLIDRLGQLAYPATEKKAATKGRI